MQLKRAARKLRDPEYNGQLGNHFRASGANWYRFAKCKLLLTLGCLDLALGACKPGIQTPPSRPSAAAATTHRSEIPSIERPDDTPFLPAPRGQLSQKSPARSEIIAPRPQPTERFALTVSPSFSRLKLDFVGREAPFSGAGIQIDGQVALAKWLWFQAGWQRDYYAVSATAKRSEDDDKVTPTAADGVIRWQEYVAGLRYAIDTGYVIPLIEGGAGLVELRSPDGVQSGQAGSACASANQCDPGLRCNLESKRCEASYSPILYAGLGAQWRLGRYFGLGAVVRYYAPLSSPQSFPARWTLGLRFSLRY